MSQTRARREFHFEDAKSRKFWAITLDGTAHTVHYGRIGTNGQTKTKELDSADDALASYEKLVAQKTRKGYVEVDGDGAAPPPAAPKKEAAETSRSAKKRTAKAAKEAASEEAEPASEGERAAPVATSAERDLGLAPEDYYFATWRALPALERPEPRPFDMKDGLARLRKVRVGGYGWDWDWSRTGIGPGLSPEEASFWLEAMRRANRGEKPADLANTFGSAPPPIAGPEEVGRVLEVPALGSPSVARRPHLRAEVVAAAEALLEPAALVDCLAGAPPGRGGTGPSQLLAGFLRYAVPYWTLEVRAAQAARLAPALDPAEWPADFYTPPARAFYLAALLGAPDALEAVVANWPDDRYDPRGHGWEVDHYHLPQLVIAGLGSPDLVQHHMRRLNLPLRDATQARAWLAHTEDAGLDWLGASVARKANKDEAAALATVLERVAAPEAAPVCLDLLSSKASKQARGWLLDHPAHAARGLVDVAGGKGKRASAALDVLRELKRRGHAAVLRAAAADAPADAARKVAAEVIDREEKTYDPFGDDAPAWLTEAVAAAARVKKAKAPDWLDPVDLPPVVVGERRLADDHVAALLKVLQKAPLGSAVPEHALVGALKAHADRRALGAFAWRLFELWLTEGAPSKEKWALTAVGHLGDDPCALELAPKIRVWPGESQHARAVLGLDVLRAIGTDTALMQIHGIATKLKYKGLKRKAQEAMEAIAEARGMSRPELEDRIVPDLDLDPEGRRVFDYGPRRFEFALGPDLKPMVRDEAGKLRKDPPKPAAKDDPEQAAAAQAEWKLFKKQLREVMKIQPARLEQAMVTGRRWSPDAFRRLLVAHPLMTHLVRLVLWGDYGGDAAPRPFRVSEDRELLDAEDEPVAPAGEVGIVHPLELDEAARGRWGEVFADYELVPPFPQLGREVHRLEGDEAAATRLDRLAGREVGASTLVGTLDRLGWTRGTPQDAGIFAEHSKQFPGAGVTAVVQYEDGVPAGAMTEWDDQRVTGVAFLKGLRTPDECVWLEAREGLKLGDVDPIVLSEVIRDLGALEAKAR